MRYWLAQLLVEGNDSSMEQHHHCNHSLLQIDVYPLHYQGFLAFPFFHHPFWISEQLNHGLQWRLALLVVMDIDFLMEQHHHCSHSLPQIDVYIWHHQRFLVSPFLPYHLSLIFEQLIHALQS